MKKSLIVLMCVLFATAAFAQFDLGIKLGANYSYIQSEELDFEAYVDEFSDLQNVTGFVGGAYAAIGLGSFAIQAEGLFSMEGFSIEGVLDGDPSDAINNTTIRTNYLNAVLAARYNLDLAIVKPFVLAGVNVGIPLGESEIESDLDDPEINLDNFDFTKLGFAIGAGVKIFNMVDVEVRYVQGITDIYTAETDDSATTFANLVRLSLGFYIF